MKQQMSLCMALAMLTVSLGVFMTAEESSAMPGFARKYDAPCTSCHIVFPKLNEFGIAFKQRGYRMDDEGPGKPVWKLPGIPVGGIAQVAIETKDDEGATPKRSTEANVTGVEFFFGGVLGPNISFFGDFGADVAAGEPLTPDLAFIIFDDLVSDSRLNLKIGGFDVDFPFLSDPRSITLSPYLAVVNARDEDGELVEGVSLGRRGVEINGFFESTGTRYAVGIGNAPALEGENSLQAYHAWVAQTLEIAGFPQTLGVIGSIEKSGDEAAGTDDDTQSIGAALDLHYGLTGLILAFYQHSGNSKLAESDVDSFLAELIHTISQNLIAVARFDYQDVDSMKEEKTQLTGGIQYMFLPNVKGQVEVSLLKETDAAGVETDVQTGTAALTFGF